MKSFIAFLLGVFPVFCLAQNVTVIRHVSVIDMKDSNVKKDQTVIIEGNKVASFSSKTKIPASAKIINGKNKFLIPGLWDMHVHMMLSGRLQYFLPLFVANGITGIRDMGGSFPIGKIRKLKDSIQQGLVAGPRIGAMTGKILEGPGNNMDIAVTVQDTTEARKIVKEYKEDGADFIKVYNLLSKDVYETVLSEAKKQQMTVEGHIPFSMTASEVSDLGQITIEHSASALTVPAELFISCSFEETELRKELKKDIAEGKETRAKKEEMATETYDENKAKALFKKFKSNGTWQCPTIVLNYASMTDSSARMNDPRLQYIPASIVENWNKLLKQRMAMIGDATTKIARFNRRLQLMKDMHQQGVRFLAGTDVLNPYVFPGFSLHDELAYLVKAGLTPYEALQTATINPAIFLKSTDSLGTIEKGKIADMILLDANPLENISNTKKIYAVIINGKFFARKDLDDMLNKVKSLIDEQ
jgi:hypothetical protein